MGVHAIIASGHDVRGRSSGRFDVLSEIDRMVPCHM